MRRAIWGLVILFVVTPALAVTTSHWTHTTEADFKPGQFHNTVATNFGDVRLSRAVKTLLEQEPKVSAVYALAEAPDHTVYAGTGPEGILLQIKDDKVSTAATLPEGTSIFSLLIDKQGQLLIGTGGEKGQVLRLGKDGGKPTEVFSAEGVQYVWAMTQTPDGNLYVATGPNGELFEITPDGKSSVILDSDEHNLLSMISDGKDILYVGTDPNGLVYRVNRKTKESFVLYDADESEVSALALDDKGNLYAGTAEASDQENPQQAEAEAAKEAIGRPEPGTGGAPIPSQPPTEPKPPEVPNPNPGQPEPIPKKTPKTPKMMAIHPTTKAKKADEPGDTPGENPDKPGKKRPKPDEAVATTAPKQPTPVNTAKAGEPRNEGNAIYKIDPDGFVTEVFRQPALVLSMIARNGVLLVGTGSEGLIYQVDPEAQETTVMAKVDPKQVTALLATHDGRVMMGMSNVGALAAMSSGFASDGTYISPVLDATQVARFGKIQLHGTLPAGTTLKVASRSGNVAEPSEASWSKWSEDVAAVEFLRTNSPMARFFQYRLTFTSSDGGKSPIVGDVDIAYQVPNLAPQIKSVKIGTGGKDGTTATDADAASGDKKPRANPVQTISWEATDPNDDTLIYSIFFRSSSDAPWILLKDKLKEATYDWDTQTVADGRYEVKVVASDAPSNPAGTEKEAVRVSDPVIIDNTPPVIGDVRTLAGIGEIRIDLRIVDHTSTVASCDYAVDSNDDWQTVLPTDKIFDSSEEMVSFTARGLKPGPHQIAIRAADARGNVAFHTLVVAVEGPKAQP